MANTAKGEASLKLADGRDFTIVLDFEALIEAEQAYGKPLQALMTEVAMGFMGATRAMLYGALRAKHPTITMYDCAEMLRTDMEAVRVAIEASVKASFPDNKPGAEAEGGEKGNPLGTPSGPSGAKRA